MCLQLCVCANCNRMIGVCVPSDSDMTHEQIDLFITQTRARFERIGVVLEEIMIMGGGAIGASSFYRNLQKIKRRTSSTILSKISFMYKRNFANS